LFQLLIPLLTLHSFPTRRSSDLNHRAARSCRRVQNAVYHQRRSFELVLRAVAEVVRLDAPGDFEVAEIGGVDLIQRPVSSPCERSEEHTSELQSRGHLVCRLLLE